MEKILETVLFDLDGTLLDTLEDLARAVDFALDKRGLPGHTLQEYRQMVGHGVRNLVARALPEPLRADDTQIDSCLQDFKAYYTSHIDVHTRPYPGMKELLSQLCARGVQLAIVSNKFQEGTEHLIREFFPGIPFAAILGNREGYPLKPDPEIVGEVLRKTGSHLDKTVLVGDSPTDMLTAANGGIRGIAVQWGYRPMTANPQYSVVASAEELEALLSPIRRASKADLPAVNTLLREVLAVHHTGRPDLFKAIGKKYSDEELISIFSSDETPVFVYDDGQVLGYVFCAFQHAHSGSLCPVSTLYIDDLCVSEHARGKGIGKRLFLYAKALARSRGCHNLTLHAWSCNPAALTFYTHLGLKPQYTALETVL